MGYYAQQVLPQWKNADRYAHDAELLEKMGGRSPHWYLRWLRYVMIPVMKLRKFIAEFRDVQLHDLLTPREYVYALLHYGLVGTSLELENLLEPRKLFRGAVTRVRIEWHDNGEGQVFAETDVPQEQPWSLREIVADGFRTNYYGCPAEHIVRRLTTDLMADLREGKVTFPCFVRDEQSSPDVTYLRWLSYEARKTVKQS